MDLWGGYADGVTKRPWREDTIVTVMSTTKGVSSMALAVAHSRGLLDYDERVATYWPEFAANGKQDVTVRQLLSHQAGLPVIDTPLDLETLADLDALGRIIGAQAPKWEPGTRHGYHGISLGWYESELLRRVDPQHRSIGRYFAEEVAAPLGSTSSSACPTPSTTSAAPRSTPSSRPRCCCTCTSSRRSSCWASSTRAASPARRSATRTCSR